MGMGSKFAIALLTVGCASTIFAAEVLKSAEVKDFQKNSKLTAEKGTFVCKGSNALLSSKAIPVDPSKKYKISGKFRAKAGSGPTILYFGYAPYDAKNRGISSAMVYCLPNTETELVEPAKIGDTVLKVKDASKWNKTTPHRIVAFNAKSDFSDLPNHDLSVITEGKIENKGGVWQVTLKAPLKKAYAKGTKVRQHSHGSAYIYNACPGRKTSADWQTFSGTISGHAKSGNPNGQWWPGTKFVRVLMLVNYGAKGNSETEFKDIVVETID